MSVSSNLVADVNQLNKSYGDVRALDNFDLKVRQGEVLAILGPNGAGKTTLIKCLLGRIRGDTGSVRVFGGAPQQREIRSRIGAMLQVAKLPATLNVSEHIALFRSYYPQALGQKEVLEVTGLTELARRRFSALSGGQQQRLLFALAICGNPDLIFLDEPTVGLDVESRRALWKMIRDFTESGKTILFSTHYLEEADSLADRVVVINQGKKIAEGTPEYIKSFTSGKIIRCKCSADLENLTQIDGVTSVQTRGSYIEIYTSEAEKTLGQLLQDVSDVEDISVGGAALEDAFISLTAKNDEQAIRECTQ